MFGVGVLADNHFGDDGAKAIGEGLLTLPSLTTLDLGSELKGKGKGKGERGKGKGRGKGNAAFLCVSLCVCVLCMLKGEFVHSSTHCFVLICVSMWNCLPDNAIRDEGAQALGEGFKSLSNLKTLSLYRENNLKHSSLKTIPNLFY